MKLTLVVCCFVLGILNVHANEIKSTTSENVNDNVTILAKDAKNIDAAKDKRQIGKDTSIYANHRSADASANGRIHDENNKNIDDNPENGQETIYNAKTNQFLIRPISPHQHQQHESHQAPQLRNFPSTIRPHSGQLLQQSQEVQHFSYLQDITRYHPKYAVPNQGKSHATRHKQGLMARPIHQSQLQYSNADEAEQRYDVAVRPTNAAPPALPHTSPALPYRAYPLKTSPVPQLQQPASPNSHQQLQTQQQQYQIIPEEQFIKLLKEELEARSYHDAQIPHQQQQQSQPHQREQHNQRQDQQQQQRKQQYQYQQLQQQQQSQQQEHEQQQRLQQTVAESAKILQPTGLGSYRQRLAEDATAIPEYVQYVPHHRGGPKYLPLPNKSTQPAHPYSTHNNQQFDEDSVPIEMEQSKIPPQTDYYQPQVSYKTLPNHPLAKSSLEKEIEKLLASNKPSAASTAAVQILDNSNEPSTAINQHEPRPARPVTRPIYQTKQFISTPNTLLDANNQPFIPSLFKFSKYQEPTQIFPTQIPQHIIDTKKLGPVVYPTQTATQRAQPITTQSLQPTQPTQQQSQAVMTNETLKPNRSNQFGNKTPAAQKFYEKPTTQPQYATTPQYYEYGTQSNQHINSNPTNFYPSPPDPIRQQPTAQPQKYTGQHESGNYHQFPSPQLGATNSPHVTPASQSSIFVSQGTGIATPSRPTTHKPKTAEDVRQLHLPAPGGKPLTQAEFQALVDAGYPVTAVPVPVAIPFEQYVRDHPDYRNQPIDYAKLMRLGTRNFLQHQQRSLGAPSEPSVTIVSTPDEQQTATGIGGGSVTYLRPIIGEQKRRTRDEQETKVPDMPVQLEDIPKA